MPVNPNKSAPRSWIADCPTSSTPDTETLRRHSWEEKPNDPGTWKCHGCGIEIDEDFFKSMDIADVITPTSLDITLSMWLMFFPRHRLNVDARMCPRY